MTRLDIAKEMDSFIEEAYFIVKDRLYGKNIVRVHYSGENLCTHIIIMAKKTLEYTIVADISTENFSVIEKNKSEIKGLLSIKSLKRLFEIYSVVKSKTDYYNECYNNSCIRHLQ